jgi:hypothetical protein
MLFRKPEGEELMTSTNKVAFVYVSIAFFTRPNVNAKPYGWLETPLWLRIYDRQI